MPDRDRCVTQQVLSVILPVSSGTGAHHGLASRLQAIRHDWYKGQSTGQHRSPLQYVPTLHVLRFAIIAPTPDLRKVSGDPEQAPAFPGYRPHLLFECWYDGDRGEFLEQLLSQLPPGAPGDMQPMNELNPELLAYCDATLEPGDADGTRQFLEQHDGRNDQYNAPFVGARGRTAESIRHEHLLYHQLRQAIDENLRQGRYDERDPESIHRELRSDLVTRDADGSEFVSIDHDGQKITLRPPSPELGGIARIISEAGLSKYAPRVVQVLTALLLLAMLVSPVLLIMDEPPDWAWPAPVSQVLIVLALMLICAVLMLVQRERRDDQYEAALRNPSTPANNDDHVLQNPMTSSIPVKPGRFRLASLKTVLWFARWWTTYISTDGKLAGISSIHFARWSIVTDPPLLLFTSNYNRTWESYLGEFVDETANAMTALWTHAHGFPRTRWLVTEGAQNEQKFKNYSRAAMLETQLWYSGYWDISVLEILRNSRLRRGLFREYLDADEAREWVGLL